MQNKCDLPSAPPADRPAALLTSAVTRQGIDDLLALLSRRIVPDPPPPGAAVPFTARQIESIDELERGMSHTNPQR